MIKLKDFVKINAHKEYEDMDEEEQAYWQQEYEDSMRYSQEEERCKVKNF